MAIIHAFFAFNYWSIKWYCWIALYCNYSIVAHPILMLTCTPNATLHAQDYVLNLRNYNFAHLLLTAHPKLTCDQAFIFFEKIQGRRVWSQVNPKPACTPERMLNFHVTLHTYCCLAHLMLYCTTNVHTKSTQMLSVKVCVLTADQHWTHQTLLPVFKLWRTRYESVVIKYRPSFAKSPSLV